MLPAQAYTAIHGCGVLVHVEVDARGLRRYVAVTGVPITHCPRCRRRLTARRLRRFDAGVRGTAQA